MQFKSEIDLFDAFAEAAMLNQKYDPWMKSRVDIERRFKDGCIRFAEFYLLPTPKNSYTWWYPFEGVTFLGIIPDFEGYNSPWVPGQRWRRPADEVMPCRVIGKTKIVRGPGILMTDLILL